MQHDSNFIALDTSLKSIDLLQEIFIKKRNFQKQCLHCKITEEISQLQQHIKSCYFIHMLYMYTYDSILFVGAE